MLLVLNNGIPSVFVFAEGDTDQYTCPCFSLMDDFQFLENIKDETIPIGIDIHRKRSCATPPPGEVGNGSARTDENVGDRISLLWAYIDPEMRTKSNFVLPVDAVKYYSHTAMYNPGSTAFGQNICGSEDWLMGDLRREDAQSCVDLLRDTCAALEDVLCPCFSLSDLELAKTRVLNGDLILNSEMTCHRENNNDSDSNSAGSATFYGLYQRSNFNSLGDTCDFCTTPLFAVDPKNAGCMNGGDMVIRANERQALHCVRLVEGFCESFLL